MKKYSTPSGRKAGKKADERVLNAELSTSADRCRITKLTRVPEPGSQEWRQATGLLLLSDLSRNYEASRQPRGPYSVSLPEDLI